MKTFAAMTGVVILAACAHAPAAAPAPTAVPTTVPAATSASGAAQWKRHDAARPQPRVARPTTAVTTRPPSDATVLFDGSSLESWRDENGNAARWRIADGTLEVVPSAGSLRTSAVFGDVQLHIEWLIPVETQGEGEARGNSGVVFMGKYEVQILDSYGNTAFADAQSGAVYGQEAPLVNASLPPGEWQSFDIVFHAPVFESGRLLRAARVTVFQNGVLVEDDVKIRAPTSDAENASVTPHADRLPLYLQNGAQPVRFRNIWIRELNDGE